MKRIIRALLPAAILPAALLFPFTAQAQAQDELKIGALVTLSGPGAAWGQAMLYAAQFAADDVNSQGGLEVGGKRYKVVVIPYDDKYQSGEAVTAANRLVTDDKVKYIIGPMGSAPTLAVQPITERNKIIVLALGFTAKALSPEKPYSFRPNLTTEETSYPAVAWMVKHFKLKKVGAMFPNDETGQQMSGDLDRAYTKAGAALSSKETFERGRVDMVPLLTRMMASGIDAIDLNGDPPDMAGLIVKQARELGFKGPIVRNGGPGTPEIVAVAGKAAEGVMVSSLTDSGNQAVNAYAKRYQDKYKRKMNGFSPAFYDGTHMLFVAMQKAGTVTDTQRVREELERIKDYKGIQGTLNWTGKDKYGINHQMDAPFFVSEIRNGVEVVRAVCNVQACEDAKQ
ncbi:ABC transporter substrate-binding protein [Bordetella genomosp. 9]|uniref:Amino acid ABC transporter substrate-binding protein n=1 Tax=Bordetella genomosp. 9 TaxID=1416803 RepID=A0A1W6YZQ9_9BORD|nr:ABC transporter substrate-binding protein [Bordetella genomosp. 9]ARP86558.1 amino acid ABC transporter substrate-binding protein [Bordetella genomosp. 9]